MVIELDILILGFKRWQKSDFVEVNHFEKRNKDYILYFSCNQRFGRTMAFFCSMDVSVV